MHVLKKKKKAEIIKQVLGHTTVSCLAENNIANYIDILRFALEIRCSPKPFSWYRFAQTRKFHFNVDSENIVDLVASFVFNEVNPLIGESLMNIQNEHYKRLRMLDIDDLILLQHLLNGGRPSTGAALLGLTPPAVSHRLRKIEDVFEIKLFERKGSKLNLNPEGRELSEKANRALMLMAN